MDPNTAQPTNQEPQPQETQNQSSGKKSKLVPILLVGLVIIILVVIGEVIYLVLSDSNDEGTQTQTQTVQNQGQLGDPESQASNRVLPTKEPHSLPEFNDERTGDVNAILDAVLRFREDNNGGLPTGVTSTPQEISSTGVNLCSDLVPQYMSAIPIDPATNNKVTEVTDCSEDYQTGYSISQSGNNVLITLTDEKSLDDIKAQQ